MPIYEFQCQACGTVIEVLQKVSDPHITDCEACGKAEMKKKVTAAAFRLSGAGWYETDFKDGEKKKNLTESETKSVSKDQNAGDSAKSGEATKSAEPSKSTEGSNTSKEGSDKSTDKSSNKTSTKTDSTSTSKKNKDPSTD